MELTAYQQDMLNGAFGRGKAMAMEIQVGIGKCFDAARLVPIRKAHVFSQRARGGRLVLRAAVGGRGLLCHCPHSESRLFPGLLSEPADAGGGCQYGEHPPHLSEPGSQNDL